jgi:hypothetical protein
MSKQRLRLVALTTKIEQSRRAADLADRGARYSHLLDVGHYRTDMQA